MHNFNLLFHGTSEIRGGSVSQLPTVINRWLSVKVEQVNVKNEPLCDVIQQFQKFIESDPTVLFLFQQMFNQVPTTDEFDYDSFGNPSVSTG